MLLPLGTDRHKLRPIVVTHLLIAINLGVYLAMLLLERSGSDLAAPSQAWAVLSPGRSGWWTYLTYAFLHAGPGHVIFNMVALWVFGPDVEDRLGRIGFTLLYLAGAVGAGAGHAFLDSHPVVGASGAIAAVTGSFLVFFPYVHVKTLLFFFYIGIFHITAWWYIAFSMATDLFGLAWSGSNIAYGAHLGGYVFGAGISLGLLAVRLVPREPYDLFTIGRQAARRRAFKAAHAHAQRPAPVERRPREPQEKQPDGPGAAARFEVQERLAKGDVDGAAGAYLRMRGLAGTGELPPLGRRQLYEISNHLFQSGDYTNAADAYRQFLCAYGGDAEAPRVLLMLGLINARFLNDPTEAKRLLMQAAERLASDEDLQLTREILDELGVIDAGKEHAMDRTRVKICGITSPEAARAAVEAGADALGFVFAEGTPRAVDPDAAFAIMGMLPPMVDAVGVFRDATLDQFIEIEQRCPTDWSQLHGDESEGLVRDCGPRVIRGIRFREGSIAADLARWDAVDEVEAILVDGSAGGEGAAFDWAALVEPMRSIAKPVILAGGLTPENVGEAIRLCRPYAVDVSSGVEAAPGVKDTAKVRAFCRAVREADARR